MTLPCFHIFHAHCAARWLAESGVCPICKHRVEPDEGDVAASAPAASSAAASSAAAAEASAAEAARAQRWCRPISVPPAAAPSPRRVDASTASRDSRWRPPGGDLALGFGALPRAPSPPSSSTGAAAVNAITSSNARWTRRRTKRGSAAVETLSRLLARVPRVCNKIHRYDGA
mmetsp:Transcript_24009/g.76065  ORF Transcript_24009/g.76065 Transcript_24009/m.76065 type:complete len:173 (+) Transcript_24009:385-903(+)